jgi:PAN domain
MRMHVLLATILLSAPLAAVDGINLPGSDYKNFTAASASVCRNSCGGDPQCQAYTWVKPGIQGPDGRCWLKFRVPTLVKDACCDSGSRQNIDPSHLKAEDRTDRPGLDYTNFETDSWTTCESACKGDGRCMAWSYARRGIQGPRGRCWLKGQVPNPISNAGVVSGVKFRPRAVPID